MTDLWPAVWLSLRVAVLATIVAAVVGVPIALAMARRRFVGKSLVEGLILLPMVLPPTVVGYVIIMAFGARGWLSSLLQGYSIVFRFEGAVLAAAIVAVPMLYLPAKAGFASVERELEDIATLMGANRWQVFWHVSVPLAARGLASGLVLAFARALGEFGATVMVFGWQPNRTTLPIAIYADFEQGELAHATPAVVALTVISLALVMVYNASSASKQS
ncbi:MAG: molybdate ABC transporter permease subunit [Tepidisphaeraceae bacterium]